MKSLLPPPLQWIKLFYNTLYPVYLVDHWNFDELKFKKNFGQEIE